MTDEQEGLNQLDKYLGDKLNGEIKKDEPRIVIYKDGKEVEESLKTEHDNIVGEDKLGNKITLPGGFKTAKETGETVEDGIVIEDSIGNQFVWVPVSNIDGDGVVGNQSASGLITKKDGSKVQITLGRYKFNSTWNSDANKIDGTGVGTLVQRGAEYANVNTDNKYEIGGYSELAAFRESDYGAEVNATAYNLEGLIESVKNNYGYYIARYEASFGSGDQPDSSKANTSKYITNQKPVSKPSIAHTRASNVEALTEKMLWNYINQGDASKVSRNMYAGNSYVESDLVNSYIWDTTTIYIQAMGNENYSNKYGETEKGLLDTGKTEDEKCNIFDMAGNLSEWTTECGSYYNGGFKETHTIRGGCFRPINSVECQRTWGGHSGASDVGFRIVMYIRNS